MAELLASGTVARCDLTEIAGEVQCVVCVRVWAPCLGQGPNGRQTAVLRSARPPPPLGLHRKSVRLCRLNATSFSCSTAARRPRLPVVPYRRHRPCAGAGRSRVQRRSHLVPGQRLQRRPARSSDGNLRHRQRHRRRRSWSPPAAAAAPAGAQCSLVGLLSGRSGR